MMMPVMDGATLISALQRIDPHVRVIASSGINENVSRLRDSHPSVRSFLQKPYTADTLITTVHNVLLEERTR